MKRNPVPWIIAAVIVVIGLVAVVAIAASGDDDDAVATDDGSTELVQVAPVTVTGDPLVPFAEGADPSLGAAAPVLDGVSFDQTPVTIGGEGEGPTMVVFLAHWCPHCNDEVPLLVELDDEGAFPDDLRIVGVSVAVAPDRPNYPPSTWLAEEGWPWEAMVDSADSASLVAYGVSAFPFTVILDEDGNVLSRHAGASSKDQIVARVDAALAVA